MMVEDNGIGRESDPNGWATDVHLKSLSPERQARVGVPLQFAIERDPSSYPFDVIVYGHDLRPIDSEISMCMTTPTTTDYSFVPESEGRYVIGATKGKVATAGWPCVVSKCTQIGCPKELFQFVFLQVDCTPASSTPEHTLARSGHELSLSPIPESTSDDTGIPTEKTMRLIGHNPVLRTNGPPHPRIIEGTREGYAGIPSSFSVSANDQGELDVRVEGEHKVDVDIENGRGEDPSFRVNYLARHPGSVISVLDLWLGE